MVEFKTTLNADKTAAVNKNVFKKLWWVFLLTSLLVVIIGVCGILFREDEADLYMGIVITVLGVCFTPLVMLLTFIIQKSMNKSMPVLSDDTLSVFTFDNCKITILQSKGDDYHAETVCSYKYLYKVAEDNDYYFLYISKAQCHVIDKASLTQGSLMELNAYLSANLGFKFQSKK